MERERWGGVSLEVGDSGTRKVKRKKEVRKELRRWKRAGADGERYRMAKREYEKLCDRKKREENERWLKQGGRRMFGRL